MRLPCVANSVSGIKVNRFQEMKGLTLLKKTRPIMFVLVFIRE